MLKINEKELVAFISECSKFYADKKNEIIKVYEIKLSENEIHIIDEIAIPEKVTIIQNNQVSINIKYLIYLCLNFQKNGTGMLIVHNHGQQSTPSPIDLSTKKQLIKIIEYYNIYPFVFSIYSKSQFYYCIHSQSNEYSDYIINIT